MKKLLILFILLILSIFLLSGCGIYNLSNFTLPDDAEFLALIQELDTPEKICNYMKDNFTYKINIVYDIDPYTLWKTKKGDCSDFALFGIYIANYHDHTTFKIKISFKETSAIHDLAVYLEDGKYTYSSNQDYYPLYASNFDDIVSHCFIPEYELESYKVYDYDINLIEQATK